MSHQPCIGITMGDPAGIGPEIVIKALAEKEIYDICRPVVLGDENALSSAASSLGRRLSLKRIQYPDEAKDGYPVLNLIPLSQLSRENILPGKPTPEGGKAMVRYIIKAVEWAREGKIEAMVTGPINKEAMYKAGYHYEGHTQLIAHLTDAKDYVMMLAGEKLCVTLVTTHCAYSDVPSLLSVESVYATIANTAWALENDFALDHPRLAVAALNPHAGESGLFGTEDQQIIAPAVQRALKEGFNVAGPLPADTLFHKAANGGFDAVVAMYHDQGLIPLKLLHFSDAVNVTLGLPIVRTSVDHGTAYDIAGTGQAGHASLLAAVRMAALIAKNRKWKQNI